MARLNKRARRQRRPLHRGRKALTVPLNAEQVAAKVRMAIKRHTAVLTKRITANRAGIAAAEITAAFGADSAALASYLAAGQALGTVPTPAPVAGTAPATAEAAK